MSTYATPGQYLRYLRQRAGMEPLDLALCIDTVPPVSARNRLLLIEAVEADLVRLREEDGEALARIPWLGLDCAELEALRGESDGAIRIVQAPTLAERTPT